MLPLKQCVLIIYALLFTPLDLWLGKLRNLQFYERRPWFGMMLMIYLVGVLRNEGKGRAVRYIRVINASNIVINVVKISVIPKNTP